LLKSQVAYFLANF